jgi:predicted dehydrogenase
MMANPLLAPDEYQARYTSEFADRLGIGIVGCGSIVQTAHLPAYARYGYRVRAVCDVRTDRAQEAAAKFGIPEWTDDLDVVLSNPDVHVLDLAVQAHQRLDLLKRIAAAGKHVISQKPLAATFGEAREMVNICASAGVTLMVNQQARWASPHRALKTLLDRGLLGELYSVMHFYRDYQDFEGSWFVRMPYATILDHGIHYFDLSRYFTGRNPARVKSVTAMTPGQNSATPMIYTVLCDYGPAADVVSTLHFNNIVRAKSSHRYEWHLDGTRGSASATLTEVRFASADAPEEMHVIALTGRWYIDAFAAAMGEMLDAVGTGRQPVTSGRDHLESLRIAFAAIESAETGDSIELGGSANAIAPGGPDA